MIRVNEDYIIEIDTYNYIAKMDQHKKGQVKDRATGEYIEVDVFKTVGYYKDLSGAIKGIINDMSRRQLSDGRFSLEDAIHIIRENNGKVYDLLEKVLEV